MPIFKFFKVEAEGVTLPRPEFYGECNPEHSGCVGVFFIYPPKFYTKDSFDAIFCIPSLEILGEFESLSSFYCSFFAPVATVSGNMSFLPCFVGNFNIPDPKFSYIKEYDTDNSFSGSFNVGSSMSGLFYIESVFLDSLDSILKYSKLRRKL